MTTKMMRPDPNWQRPDEPTVAKVLDALKNHPLIAVAGLSKVNHFIISALEEDLGKRIWIDLRDGKATWVVRNTEGRLTTERIWCFTPRDFPTLTDPDVISALIDLGHAAHTARQLRQSFANRRLDANRPVGSLFTPKTATS